MATTVLRSIDWLVTWKAEGKGRHVYKRGQDLAFSDDKITYIGPRYEGAFTQEIDCRQRLVMPGLINIHSHPNDEPLSKGIFDELGNRRMYGTSLYEFMPLFDTDAAGYKAAATVAYCELLKSGVTTLVDISAPWDGWLELMADSGLRGVIAASFRESRWFTKNGYTVDYEWDKKLGREKFDAALRLLDHAKQHACGRLTGMVMPSQLDTCSPELIRDAAAAAKERDLPWQIHAAQSMMEFLEIMRRHGMTAVQYLDSLGVLDERLIMGHAIYMDHHPMTRMTTQNDLPLVAERGTKVAHCPVVFERRGMKLQSFGSYSRAGVTLGVGTDTYPHNMLEELRAVGIISRMATGDVFDLRTSDVFNAATIGGAAALRRDDIGRLKVGAKADVVLVDMTHPMMQPSREPIRSLVFAAAERAVSDVFVDGKQVVKDHEVTTLDYQSAAMQLNEVQRKSMEEATKIDYAKRPVDVMSPHVFEIER